MGRRIRHKAAGKWALRAPKTNRPFRPNIQRARVLLDGTLRRVNICTRCLRTLTKPARLESGGEHEEGG